MKDIVNKIKKEYYNHNSDILPKLILEFKKEYELLNNYDKGNIIAYILDNSELTELFDYIFSEIKFDKSILDSISNEEKYFDYLDIGMYAKHIKTDTIFKICYREYKKDYNNSQKLLLINKNSNEFIYDECESISLNEIRKLKINQIFD